MEFKKTQRLYRIFEVLGISISMIMLMSIGVISENYLIHRLCVAAIAVLAMLFIIHYAIHKEGMELIRRIIEMDRKTEDSAVQDQGDINYVLGRLEAKLEQTSLAEALKTEAELHALQNQINPHFLYNTLEIIRSKALIQGNEDVADMTEALALQFRYCINRSGDMATFEQELENVHNYILIQSYRYGSRLSYREEISEEAQNAMTSIMPVMTLQPLMENAIIHGIVPKLEGGTVILRADVFGGRLHISIEDNGVGISEKQLKGIRERLHYNVISQEIQTRTSRSMGIALGNVNQRIKFCFGNEFGVDVVSTQQVGTTVKIILPKRTEK